MVSLGMCQQSHGDLGPGKVKVTQDTACSRMSVQGPQGETASCMLTPSKEAGEEVLLRGRGKELPD